MACVRWGRLFAGWLILLVGCASSAPVENAPRNVEAYLRARVRGDVAQMVALSCADWEQHARLEALSVQGRSPQLSNMVCRLDGREGQVAWVTCQGRLLTSYGGERREFDLAERTFKTVAEAGDWRVCGYR